MSTRAQRSRVAEVPHDATGELVGKADRGQIAGAGHSEWVRVDDIQTDETYQRDVNYNHVAKIAAEFDPNLLGALDLAKRHDGSYWVMDGQHRLLALRQRGYGDKLIHAHVWVSTGAHFEATIFTGKNDNRKAIPPYARWRARLKAGAPNEIAVKELLDGLGIRVIASLGKGHQWGSGHGEDGALWAIGTVCQLHEQSPVLTARALRALHDAWSDNVKAYEANLVHGAVAWIAEHDGEFRPEQLVDALAKTTPDEVLDQAWQLKANRSYRLSTFVAAVYTSFYNRAHSRQRVEPRAPADYQYSFRAWVQRNQTPNRHIRAVDESA